MDEIFEVILEFFAECYIEAMTLLVPEKKIRKIKKTTLKIIVAIEAVALLGLLIAGFVMVDEDREIIAGKIMMVASSAIIILQIAFGLIIRKKKNKGGVGK